MSGRKHLFVALSRKGWGETSLGLEAARQVRDRGDNVAFVAHSGSVPALSGSGFDVEEVPDHALPFIPLLLEELVASEHAASVVLCDFLTTNYTLTRAGVDPMRLLDLDVPCIVMDTWQYALTGSTVDVYGADRWDIGTWIERVDRRLVPVPIGQPDAPGAYRSLPAAAPIAKSVRRHIRMNLGLADAHRAVLLCTAGWQHETPGADGQTIGRAVPELLWTYLATLDPSVRLVHVGPVALPLADAGERYLWMPSMQPEHFIRLLNSVDLVLSVNLSATTIGAALAAGVPVLVVRNSRAIQTADAMNGDFTPRVRTWLSGALPLYPFAVWPLGFSRFLAPLLERNPYMSAVETVDLLDDDRFAEAGRALLFDAGRRQDALARQADYVSAVRALPSAADRIASYLQQGRRACTA